MIGAAEPMVRAEQVRKTFGPVEILKGVDAVVAQGSVFCLVGPSGSGKSTFLRCINHLERIDGGRLLVDGQPIGYVERGGVLHELGERAVAAQRAEIGMVFQRFNLFPHLTALQNITRAPVLLGRLSRAEADELAHQLLARVGLASKSGNYPSQLSGGQQQRVAIARALAMRPKLMLFDEPTSALDPELVGEVLAVMRDLTNDGLTMVVVTHEIGFATEVADTLAVMDAGRIIDSGPPERVINSPATPRIAAFFSRVRARATSEAS